ncbi:MAG TPA: acyltransferase [Pseudomonadales bacterium]|nr:acyltransferase [Pseudomonadales bacterium]
MRNQTVDIAKGLAGVLVVLGHAMAFRYSDGWVLQCSHIGTPFFIFLSGVFINIDRPWSESVIRKADRLLKPYLVMLLALGIVYAVIGELDVLSYLAGVLYATGPTISLVSLWFLPHVFLCVLVGIAVLQECRRWSMPRFAYVILLLFFLLLGQRCLDVVWQQPLESLWWQSMLRPARHWPGLPWSIDVLPLTLVFLLAGYLVSAQVKNFRFQYLPMLLALLVMVLSISAGYAAIDINLRIYRDVVFTTLFVFCGIYLGLSWSALLSSVTVLANIFSYVGKNFLVIMLVHMLVLRMLFRQVAQWIPDCQAWHVPLVFSLGLFLSVLMVVLVQRNRCLSMLLLPVQNHGVSR